MQINNTDMMPLPNLRGQASTPPPNLEAAESRKASEATNRLRQTSSQVIEAEYVDLHKPVKSIRQPVAPKPQQNEFILESDTSDKVYLSSNNAERTPLQKGIERYLQFEKDIIPAGSYLDLFA